MEKPRYTFGKLLDYGGYGSIYLGLDNELGIHVALKVIKNQGFDRDKQYRIAYDDAMIASQLRGHPNIVNVFDFKRDKSGQFVVIMEYIHGYSILRLTEKLHVLHEQLPSDLALYIALQICEGLEYIHTRTNEDGQPLNIIHRDITPSNIMVSHEGYVKIIDFGIAKWSMRNRTRTVDGFVKGKLGYISPEQLNKRSFDHRVDIYSTGVLLYELLTGERLFREDEVSSEVSLIRQIAEQDIDLPGLFEKNQVPDSIRPIILKAIALNQDERYASAEQMQTDIMHAMTDKSECKLRRNLTAFLKDVETNSHILEEHAKSDRDKEESSVPMMDFGGEISKEDERPIRSDELAQMESIITPSKLSAPQSGNRRIQIENDLEWLQKKIDERNDFLSHTNAADPDSSLHKIEQWAEERNLKHGIKLTVDNREICLKVLWDKIFSIGGSIADSVEEIVECDNESIGLSSTKTEEPTKNYGVCQETPLPAYADEEEEIPYEQPQRPEQDYRGTLPGRKQSLPPKRSKKLLIFISVAIILIIVGMVTVLPRIFKPVKVRITSFPQDAQLTINGESYGKTPAVIPDPLKTFQVSLQLPGFIPISAELNLKELAKNDNKVHFVFHKTVKISSNNSQTHIYVDDREITGTLGYDWETSMPLRVRAVLDGHKPLDITLSYGDDNTMSVTPPNMTWLEVKTDTVSPDVSLVYKFSNATRTGEQPSVAAAAPVTRAPERAAETTPAPSRPVAVATVDTRKIFNVSVKTNSGEPVSGLQVVLKYKNTEQPPKPTNSNGIAEFRFAADPGDVVEATFVPAKGIRPVSSMRSTVVEGQNQYNISLETHSLSNEETLKQGTDYIRQKKFNEAIAALSQIKRGSSPLEFDEYLRAQYYIATVYQTEREWDKSIGIYSDIVSLKVDHAVAYYNLATCYYSKHEYLKASENYNKVLTYIEKVQPNQREELATKCRFYDAMGLTETIKQNLTTLTEGRKTQLVREAVNKWNQFFDFVPQDNGRFQGLGDLKEQATNSVELLKSL
ncbi:protein kinase [bacterium]|nr:protein kinase [bacterium]